MSSVNLTLNNVTLSNTNSGSLLSGATGASMVIPNLTINSGSVVNNVLGAGSSGPVDSIESLLDVSSGTIDINEGGLLLNNSLTNVETLNVNEAGLLQGIGTFSNTNPIMNSGIVEPTDGTTPGVMTISGNYTQNSNGKLLADLLNTSTFSQLYVAGTAQIAGALQVDFLDGNTVGVADEYTLLLNGHSFWRI